MPQPVCFQSVLFDLVVWQVMAYVFHEDDLPGSEQMLRDQDGSQSVFGVAACVADYVGVAEVDAKGGGWVDAGVHAGY